MSTRPPEAEEHIRVRGTMVSTFPLHPSKLPVSCVHDWGMPNRNGVLTVDRTILHITYDRFDTNLIHVYARKPAPSLDGVHVRRRAKHLLNRLGPLPDQEEAT